MVVNEDSDDSENWKLKKKKIRESKFLLLLSK